MSAFLFARPIPLIKSQQIIQTDAGFSGASPRNITISSVDTDKVLMTVETMGIYESGSNNSTYVNACTFELTTATNLQLNKFSTVTRAEAKFKVTIEEIYPENIVSNNFYNSTSVALTGSETYIDITITAVTNTDKCQVRAHGYRMDDNHLCGGHVLAAELTSTTNVRVYIAPTTGAATLDEIRVQVMELTT